MKKIILSIACVLVASSLFAQEEQSQHEVTVNLGGGLSGFQNKPESGKNTLGLGGSLGIGYTFFINNQFGIGTGVEANFYQSEYSNNALLGNYREIDPNHLSEYFRLNYAYNEVYKEKQNALFVQIPLMFQFQTEGHHKFYVAAGGRVGIPVNTKFKTDASALTVSGFYSNEAATYENLPNHGFKSYDTPKADGRLSLKTAYMASLELGMKWALNDNFNLYTGVYGDYGLNDIQKVKDKGTVTYHHVPDPDYLTFDNSVTATTAVKKVIPMTFGVKLRMTFGLGDKISSAGASIRQQERIYYQAAVEEAYKRAEVARLAQETVVAEVEPEENEEQPEVVLRDPVNNNDMKILLEPVWGFDITKTVLTPEMKRILDRKIPVLKKYWYLGIVLEGHTCDVGSDQVNDKFGYERAQAVKDYFVKNGLTSTRFSTISKGKYQPAVKNDSEEARRRNRRVELSIKK